MSNTDDGAILTMGSTGDGQHWQRWAALMMINTADERHWQRWGNTDNDEQHWRWAIPTMGSTDN